MPPSTANNCTGNPNYTAESGTSLAIQVVICETQPRLLSGLILTGNPTLDVTAVAATVAGTGTSCVLSLGTNANPGVSVSGSKTVVNSGSCDIVSDSTSVNGNGAINISGGATVTTPCLVSVGADTGTGNATLNLTKCTTATNGAASVPDPFASVPQPAQPTTTGSCAAVNGNNNNLNCTPGYYSQQLNTNAMVTFQPGLYYFGQGFQVSGGSATGTAVTFFIATSQTAAVSGNASVSFSAPTAANCTSSTCLYVGIVFFGSRNSTNGNNNFSGGSSSAIAGAIYFPTQEISFTGGSTTSYTACTQIVASTITISGQAQFGDTCNPGPSFNDGSPGTIQLVQ